MQHDFEFSFVTRDEGREQQSFEVSYSPSQLPGYIRLTIEDFVPGIRSMVCPLDAEAIDLLIASLQMAKDRMQL